MTSSPAITEFEPEQAPVDQAPPNQEPSKDQPVIQQDDPYKDILARYGKHLLDQIRKTRDSWLQKRRGVVLTALKNKAFLKGDQHFGMYPGTMDAFNVTTEYYKFTGDDARKNADESMDQRPHNFYQMVHYAFVAALFQIPKTEWLPDNADVEEDRQTAKAASKIQKIIQQHPENKIGSMVKQELSELFTGGSYWKFTRYVVDSDRTGTHKENPAQMARGEVLPSRFVCFNCGGVTPSDDLPMEQAAKCPNCQSPFGAENFFSDYQDEIPQAEEAEVPNGMVLQSVHGVMQVDVDPDADCARNTPLLNLSQEVSLGWLRTTFKDQWDTFQPGEVSSVTSETMERQYRDILTSPQGYAAWYGIANQQKPTYSRTWMQPELFAELESREMAEELQKTFPKGCMICWVGDRALQIRPAVLTDEWTVGRADRNFGLCPPPVGNPAVPIQERINDCISKIDEYMDRLATGILLANARYVDAKAMNGKAILPGILNSIAFKSNAPMGAIQDAIFQVKAEIDAQIFNYLAILKQDMELLVGTPPQTFGAGTQQGVETFGGQKQQLDTGMMKLGLIWDELRGEHTEADENAIECASKNATDDWYQVVTDQTGEARNEYVRLDELKGNVHAKPDTNQIFPWTYAEIRAFWQNVLENADSQMVQWLMQEPKNIEAALRFSAPDDVIAPGASMRSKMLAVIDRLMNSEPTIEPDEVTGEPMILPSILPNKYLDDLPASMKMLESWAQENFEKLEDKPLQRANLEAYWKILALYSKENAAEQQLVGGMPPSPSDPTAGAAQPAGAAPQLQAGA